jgi:PPOX class probable F420-dependent enzyme
MEFTQHIYLGILATVYPSGGPQAFPVWFDYDGDRFNIATDADAVKVRNIRTNSKVALCITDTSRQVRSLTVLGDAEVEMNNLAAQDLHKRLAVRYMGQDEGEEWAESMGGDEMAIVRIVPTNFLWTG